MTEEPASPLESPAPDSAPAAAPSRSRWVLWLLVAVLAAAGAGGYWFWHKHEQEKAWLEEWARTQKGLAPSGGKYFAERTVIEVPLFLQSDPVWGSNLLGPSATDTLASHGCAVASAAMVLASYGVDTDPQRLNDYLLLNNGYTPESWIKWEVAATLSPEKVRFVYENDPSYKLIDENLERGNPVIVRLRYPPPSSITHFVVVCGKQGYDYLITDPGAAGRKGVYPLKDFGSKIEALRYYEPVKAAGS